MVLAGLSLPPYQHSACSACTVQIAGEVKREDTILYCLLCREHGDSNVQVLVRSESLTI